MYVLGFDLSSTTVGYSIFEIETKKLIKVSYIKYPDTCEDLLEKGFHLEKTIEKLLLQYPSISQFVIEERLKAFQAGRSNADALLTLAQLNFICQFLIKYKFNLPITAINVSKARGLVFPNIFKATRATKIKQKDFVFENVLSILGKEMFPTKIMKSGVRKGETVFLEEAQDMSDAWLISQAFFLYDKELEGAKKTKSKKTK